MRKAKTATKRKRRDKQAPYYVAYRLQSVEALETQLNALLENGFSVKHVMCGIETYTVVALKPLL